MKILVAPDSFKGSLSSEEVCCFIERGIKRADSAIEVISTPMADGGEGTCRALVKATKGKIVNVVVHDPLMRKINSYFGVLGDGKTAVIEMSAASGLTLLTESEKAPMITTTYGTGELITAALDMGYRSIIIGLGGSGTNDGGMGMAKALGVRFLDSTGREIGHGGGALDKLFKLDISSIDKRIKECTISALCDVDNPLCGPYGASHIFGGQKGATKAIIETLDANLKHYSEVVEKTTGISIMSTKGAGAAGGLGGGILAFLNGEIKKGIEIIIEVLELEKKLKGVDYVITGEGKIDSQTSYGKTPYGIAALASKHNIPVIAICGAIGEGAEVLYDHHITAMFSLTSRPMELETAIQDAPELLQAISENIARLLTKKL
jgi:glycerate kinase